MQRYKHLDICEKAFGADWLPLQQTKHFLSMKLYRFLLPALLVVSCGGGDKTAQEDGQRLFVGDDYAVTQTQ